MAQANGKSKSNTAVTVTVTHKGKTHTYELAQIRTSGGGMPVFAGSGDKDAPVKPYGGLYVDVKKLNGKAK